MCCQGCCRRGWQTSDGPFGVRASSYEAMRCRAGSEWRAGRSFEGQLVASGHSWARPAASDFSVAHEVGVELAGDVALQDAHDLADGLSFRDAARIVFAGAFIVAHAGEHDVPERVVGLAVAAGVESVPCGFAGRRWDGRDAAEMRERGFAGEPVGIVAGGDQQDRGGVDPDAVDVEQRGSGAAHQWFEELIEAAGVSLERNDATTQRGDGECGRVRSRCRPGGSGAAPPRSARDGLGAHHGAVLAGHRGR